MHKVIDVIGKNGKYYINRFRGHDEPKIVADKHLKKINNNDLCKSIIQAELNYKFGKFAGKQSLTTVLNRHGGLIKATQIFDQQINISKQIEKIVDQIWQSIYWKVGNSHIKVDLIFKKDQYKKDVVYVFATHHYESSKIFNAKITKNGLISFKLYEGEKYSTRSSLKCSWALENNKIKKVTRYSVTKPRKILSITNYLSGKKFTFFGYVDGKLNKFNFYKKGLIMSSYNISKGKIIRRKLYKAGKQIKNPFELATTEFNLPVRAQKALNKII